jgi:fatty acid desaturase
MTKFEYDMYKEYNKKPTNTSGLKFCDVLLIVFVVLKLCKIINWSWWWILSPFWIPLILVIIYVISMAIITHRRK